MTCLPDRYRPIPRRWRAAIPRGVFAAVKLYPAHATTHSAHGVTDIDRSMPVLERMAMIGMPLLIHGRGDRPEIDIFEPRGGVHRAGARPAAPSPARTAHRARNTSRPKRRSPMSRMAGPNIAATITRASPDHQPQRDLSGAASGRISTACRSPSARSIARSLRHAARCPVPRKEGRGCPRSRHGAGRGDASRLAIGRQ